MKKMTKGAIVTGLGVALLIGGGGTLAMWNQDAITAPGTIQSGDLNLTTADEGKWVSSLSGDIGSISAYRVVPGETLTYTQKLNVTLLGKELEATLRTSGVDGPAFENGNATVSKPVLTKDGEILPTKILREGDSGEVTAKTTFTFKEATTGRSSTNATYNFGEVSYVLEQKGPSTRTPAN